MRGRSIDMEWCLWAVLALSGIGCMGDMGVSQSADQGTGDGVTAGSGSAPSPTSGADSTGGAAGGSDSGEGSGTSGNIGTEGDDGPPDVCSGVDCGESGWCEDVDGQAVCACDSGYAAYGLRCLPCTSTSGTLDVDIPTATVSASFELRGEPFPDSFYDYGDIVLRDPQSGDEVLLGSTLDGGVQGVKVVPGNYEIHYMRRAGGLQVPANSSARVGTILIAEGSEPSLVVDIPAVDLHGDITMNGMAPPEGLYEYGEVVLRNPVTGDEVVLGETNAGTYQAMVIPGTYDVHYRRKLADAEAPHNRDVRFDTLVIEDDWADQDIPIEIPVTNLSGTFSVDGGDPPLGAYDSGRIMLRDLLTHDEILLGYTNELSYQLPIVTGTYEVVYRRLLGGDLVPANNGAVLEQIVLTAGVDTHDVSIETAVVTGNITVDGAPAPSSPTDDGLILLRNPQTGDEAVLGNTAIGSYTRRVVQGTYDVYYRQETSSGGVPVNTNARLDSVDITGGSSFDVNVPMVSVSASVTVGGATPPQSVFDDGLLYLVDEDTGDNVLLGNTRLTSLQRPVVPGTYDVVYVVEAAGPTMPVNSKSVLGSVDINTSTNLSVDIPVAVLQGAVTLEGALPPDGLYNQASLLLHDVATADTIDLGTIDLGAFARTVNAGTYVLVYHMLTTTGSVPANTNAGLACVELAAP